MSAQLVSLIRSIQSEIPLGASREEVRQSFGEPDDVSVPGREPVLWRYGASEWLFLQNKLRSVSLSLDDTRSLPERLGEDYLANVRGMRQSSVEQSLGLASLVFEHADELNYDDFVWLRVSGSVRLCFDKLADRLVRVEVAGNTENL